MTETRPQDRLIYTLFEGDSTMVRFLFQAASALFLFFTQSICHADVLFEGYSKVVSGGVHVGFFVSRYEFDAKKKVFTATSLLKTNELGGNITESLKAVAKEDLSPISYSYTTLVGGLPKTIDAKFEKGKMNATVKDGSKVSKVSRDLPKGSFLSSFLAYVMLKSPKGLTPNTKYEYQAIAEEDAALVKGLAFVKATEDYNGIKAYKILNDFKSTKFISYVTEKGEILSTKSPVQSIGTELVPQSSMATSGHQIPTGLLKTLFDDVPLGVQNVVSKKYQESPKSFQMKKEETAPPEDSNPGPSKGAQIPAGKGIINKTAPTEEPTATEKRGK